MKWQTAERGTDDRKDSGQEKLIKGFASAPSRNSSRDCAELRRTQRRKRPGKRADGRRRFPPHFEGFGQLGGLHSKSKRGRAIDAADVEDTAGTELIVLPCHINPAGRKQAGHSWRLRDSGDLV